MPKEWSRHKAEIARLYIDQGRTLKEVREILHERHGFKASTRAYRMRIDEWAMRKYRPREDAAEEDSTMPDSPNTPMKKPLAPFAPKANSPAPSTPVSSSSSSSSSMVRRKDDLQFGPHLFIPKAPMAATDVLALIEGPSATFYALEVLFTKWRADGHYLSVLTTLLKTPEYCQWITRCAEDGRPLLFVLIERHTPPHEQLLAGKLLLEALLTTHPVTEAPCPTWLRAWSNACRCRDWEEVKTILYEGSKVSIFAGEIFLKSALVVFAEQLLRRIIKRLRVLRARVTWVSESELLEADELRQKYLDILEECRDTNLILRPSLYKYSLEVIEVDDSDSDAHYASRCSLLADCCRHKYLQMTNDSTNPKDCCNGIDETIRDMEEREWIESCECKTPPHAPHLIGGLHPPDLDQELRRSIESDPESSPSYSSSNPESWVVLSSGQDAYKRPTDTSASSSTSTSTSANPAQATITALLHSWKSLRGFKTHVHSLLKGDSPYVFIFDRSPSAPASQNVFDLIALHVPLPDQQTLTRAILTACSTIPATSPSLTPKLTWYLSLYTSPTWPTFQSLFASELIATHLSFLSPPATKLLLDATILIVGERLLHGLKETMVRNPGYKARAGGEMEGYQRASRLYMGILQVFRERGLPFDGAWLSYALDTM